MRIISMSGYTVPNFENCCTSNTPLAKLLARILLPNNTVIVNFSRNFYLIPFKNMGF